MPIRYKVDIIAALKEKGYTSYRIRKEKLMGEATMTQLRKGQLVSWENLARLCLMLECQPGDLVEFVPSEAATLQNGSSASSEGA